MTDAVVVPGQRDWRVTGAGASCLSGPFAYCRFGSASHDPLNESVLVETSAAFDQTSFNVVTGRFPKGL